MHDIYACMYVNTLMSNNCKHVEISVIQSRIPFQFCKKKREKMLVQNSGLGLESVNQTF